MPQFYPPSSIYQPPSMGFGGLARSGPDPRSRRRRSAPPSETYAQRMERLEPVRQAAQRRAAEQAASSRSASLSAAADRSRLAWLSSPAAPVQEQGMAIERARTARAKKPLVRLSPDEQWAAVDARKAAASTVSDLFSAVSRDLPSGSFLGSASSPDSVPSLLYGPKPPRRPLLDWPTY